MPFANVDAPFDEQFPLFWMGSPLIQHFFFRSYNAIPGSDHALLAKAEEGFDEGPFNSCSCISIILLEISNALM